MRLYRITFVAGLGAGFVAGTRAGRERYDQMVKLIRQARENPAVQQAASTAQTQATSLLSTAGHKVADGAPKIASSARHKVEDHIPMLKHRDGSSSNGNAGAGKDGPLAGTSNSRLRSTDS
jgi:hypothetical protein